MQMAAGSPRRSPSGRHTIRTSDSELLNQKPSESEFQHRLRARIFPVGQVAALLAGGLSETTPSERDENFVRLLITLLPIIFPAIIRFPIIF